MTNPNHGLVFVLLALMIITQACNLPASGGPTPDAQGTAVAATLTAIQNMAGAPPPVVGNTATPVPPPTETSQPTPTPTPTPQNPLVLETSLCWVGPGDVYEVVSALKEGERVELLGQGSIPGWWIVKNPIYRDPCWVQANALQFDPGFNVSGLKVYYPPPTPTFTPSNTPTATYTPTP